MTAQNSLQDVTLFLPLPPVYIVNADNGRQSDKMNTHLTDCAHSKLEWEKRAKGFKYMILLAGKLHSSLQYKARTIHNTSRMVAFIPLVALPFSGQTNSQDCPPSLYWRRRSTGDLPHPFQHQLVFPRQRPDAAAWNWQMAVRH